MGETFRKNVIVVGAGASKEFGLPTGAELAQKISKIADIKFDDFGSRLTSGDNKIVSTLRHLASSHGDRDRNIDPYLHAAWRIRENMILAPSIDNFLDTHKDDRLLVEFGKIAICHAIQKAEADCILRVDRERSEPRMNFDLLSNT